MTDDLSAPLGQAPKPKRRFVIPRAVPWGLVVLLTAGLVGFGAFAMFTENPLGGEPVAVASANPGGSTPKAADAGKADAPAAAPAATAEKPADTAGAKTVTIIDGTSGKRQEVVIGNAKPAAAGADQRLTDTSRHGPIPKVAADGARPADVYAKPAKVAANGKGPRIAIVVSGLGIGAASTSEALAKLPAPVTFAFAPYGADLARLVTRARGEGHEVLLQVAMEPFDYPDNDPGPQTLLTSLNADQNTDRLHWFMSRFAGYVGIASYMGGRFTASEPALGPVLRETAKRGLIYFDDGSSQRSVAGQVAGAHGLPFAKAQMVIDAVPIPAEIDAVLARLEAAAHESGTAVGVATALPVSVARIAQWAKAAEARGITLVPISAVVQKPKSS